MKKKARKRKSDKEIELKKRKKRASYEAHKRDIKYECYLGTSIKFGKTNYIIAVTSPLFVYLVNKKGKIKNLTWKKWKKDKKPSTKQIKWKKIIRDSIRIILYEYKIRQKESKKIKRNPLIRRTPIIVEKKKGRKKK